jgi:hypothetical protein
MQTIAANAQERADFGDNPIWQSTKHATIQRASRPPRMQAELPQMIAPKG